VRGKRTLIERDAALGGRARGVNVIYSESIINLLSVARPEQHRPRHACVREREREREREAAGERSKNRGNENVRGGEQSGRMGGGGYGKKIIRVHQYLNEFRRREKRNEATPQSDARARASPASCSFRVHSRP